MKQFNLRKLLVLAFFIFLSADKVLAKIEIDYKKIYRRALDRWHTLLNDTKCGMKVSLFGRKRL